MALACGATVENAASSAGVSAATAYRRLKEPDFQEELRKTKADMVTRTAAMLNAAAGEAVKTLLALQKETTPAAARLGAARAVLELGIRLRESAELYERIGALERLLAASPRTVCGDNAATPRMTTDSRATSEPAGP
jgi:hypothetical protein